ncbi:thioredoxin domain-containing protein [Frigoribacterium sp. PvP032]|uniref:thioredoxin domain-containing protein n=1 Tax=Frigoribacterium sp. PvP032 TaxID=2806589 RepID=UPI001AE3C8CB|nr:DUF255 domain-containing protein [Frigoribacterium sp. PvP032]MBP1191547.1 uncharacterized protein YyaL (SSP411 family) [Frigoribacterium sp. PvP032]
MTNRLADAVSPYLRSHAGNPVDWWAWGPEAFAEAARRDVPVLVSIGYSTCHWCHVMARESFSDPDLAAHLNEHFVAIKVDREEHPDVDSSYLAAASAFTPQLGWPLTVFTTPAGQAFFAGTYFPPQPVQDHPAFRQVLDAVTEAWTSRRGEVDATARGVAAALAAQPAPPAGGSVELPTAAALSHAAARVAAAEDVEHGGFGGAPKFPVAPAQLALLGLGTGGDRPSLALASRTLRRMAASPLRDPVEGGFFRYSTRRDWGDPHYERMLYDNALLLTAYSRLALLEPAEPRHVDSVEGEGGAGRAPATTPAPLGVAAGIAEFLLARLRTPRGAFGSAQDSESTIDGRRVEGGYYALDAAERARHEAPPVDDKVLTGWNGLAIAALAEAGARHDRPDWVAAARRAADVLLDDHVTPDGRLLRASSSTGVSEAVATLEDHGMFAEGLLQLTLATGLPRYAVAARSLMEACVTDDDTAAPFAAPAGADPVLRAQGTALAADPSEGAYPSGVAAAAAAALTLHRLTGDARWRRAAERAVGPAADAALDSPVAYGTTFSLLAELAAPSTQLLVVEPSVISPAVVAQVEGELSAASAPAAPAVPAAAVDLGARARRTLGPGVLVGVVDEDSAVALADAGFELFAGRTAVQGHATAYLCHDFVCRLPVTGVEELDRDLAEQARPQALDG